VGDSEIVDVPPGSDDIGDLFSYNFAMRIVPEFSLYRAFPGLRTGILAAASSALALLLLSCSPDSDDAQSTEFAFSKVERSLAGTNTPPSELDTMLVSEELIEAFRTDMGRLAFAVRNLELPDRRTRRLFRPLDLEVRDLAAEASEPKRDPTLQALGIASRNWPIAETTQETSASLRLWRPLFDQVDRFSRAKFKIKSGHFVENADGERREFEMRVAFSGLATLRTGGLSWIHTDQTLRWRLIPGRDAKRAENWRITVWRGEEARRLDGASAWFEDVLDEAIPDLAQRETARLSIHERHVANRLLAKRAGKPFALPHWRFSDVATNRHPGLAVVDVDADGFDDLYIMTRWGRNQLLLNGGDGTFREMASEVGLDIEGFSSSAIFADFDNDGDPDLFLGRTLERSAYFENKEGHFVERSDELVDFKLPYFASSVSAVDYDGDGLLDIYVSTYSSTGVDLEQYREYLSEKDHADLARLASKKSPDLLDQLGPPNVLLHNEGNGRFTLAKNPGALRSFRHTYQSTWSDFDNDGDPDVYLSNDFARDIMVRNDGEAGFVEVTAELGIKYFGLGMGASWGDYDRDGRVDLYATNMYSTAGSRITAQLGFVDDRYREMAQGNYLYRNEGDQFRKVSGSTPPALPVERTGWSWGSQFVDVDNDGFLDLGVLNGFYTAPREVALSGDT
jgi:hypothetical protein